MRERLLFLGPPGTFSERAAVSARKHFGLAAYELTPEASILRAGSSVARDGGAAVLPAYNLLEGSVQDTLDVVADERLVLFGLVRIPIVFWAGTKRVMDAYGAVCSHPKALGQCHGYIENHHPRADVVATVSTAAAADEAAASEGVVAIAAREAIESRGLEVLDRDAGDRRYGQQNYTEFYALAPAGGIAIDAAADHSLVMVAPEVDRPGVLRDILDVLATAGLNVAKLHARPSPIAGGHGSQAPQAFILEIEAGPTDVRVGRAVGDIGGMFADFPGAVARVVGGYSVMHG